MSIVLVGLLLAFLAPAWHAGLASAQGADSPTLCQADDSYNSTTVPFEFNNNAWGDDGSGQSCLSVVNGGESWSVSYSWTGNPALVKAFPRMKAWPSVLPVPFWNVSVLQFTADWNTYVKGTENDSPEEQASAFDDIYLRSNAALDVFLSDDAWNSTQVGPPIEIMIWFWRTPSIIPLGYTESTPAVDTLEVDGMNFSLYHGFNAQGQHVFSWLAERNMTSADADYSPLFTYIWQKGLLSGALWLGQLEFGFEVMHAGEETVSEVKKGYELRIIREGDPDDPGPRTSTATSSQLSTTTSVASTSIISAATTTASEVAVATISSAALRLGPVEATKALWPARWWITTSVLGTAFSSMRGVL